MPGEGETRRHDGAQGPGAAGVAAAAADRDLGVPAEILRFMDRLPYLYWVADASSNRYWINRFGVSYTGFGSHLTTGDQLFDLVHPDDRERIAGTWGQAQAAEEVFEDIYRFRRADGAFRWQRNWAMPIHHERTGALRYWFGFSHDVDDQLLAEAAQIRSEERAEQTERTLERTRLLYAEAEELAGFGVWSLDVAAQVLTGSAGAFALLEHPGPQLTVEAFFSHIREEDVPERGQDRIWIPPPGGPAHFRLTTRAGTERICEVFTTGTLLDDDGRLRITGTVHDVTTAFLAAREARLWAAVAEDAPMVLQVIDLDPAADGGGVREVLTNARGRRYAPRRPEPACGHPAALFCPEAVGHLDAGVVELGDVEVIHEALGRRVLEAHLYRPASSRRVAFAGVDVTDGRRLEKERLQLLQGSAWAVEQERRRIAEHLHDDALQLVSAALVRLSQIGDVERAARVRSILEDTARSLRLTVLEIAPVSLLADGLQETLTEYVRQLFLDEDVDIRLAVEGDVDTWPEEVVLAAQRIVQEALSNAWRHAGAQRIRVGIRQEEDAVVGEVIDDGRGFDAIGPREGHLGLRLMHNRAESIGGYVTTGPGAEGGGTCISFLLPLQDQGR